MIINSSAVQMTSDYSAWEGERTELSSRESNRSQGRRNRLSGMAGNVVRDSVNLQSMVAGGVTGEMESSYSYAMHGESRVSRAGDDPSAPAQVETMVQSLVSGVVGRKVTLTTRDRDVTGTPVQTGQWSAVTAPGRSEAVAWVRETQVHSESEQLGFSALGQVETSDGRMIDFHLNLSMDRTMTTKIQQDALIRSRSVVMTDPLVISLDGKVPELTDTRFEFDLDADGDTEAVSFVSKGSGFLALDKNGDGRINDGSELFGPGSGDGFTDLAVYDQDQNGWIDENDEVFDSLSVWTRDDEGNDSLVSLKEAGVGAIFLGSVATPFDQKTAEGEMKGQVAASGAFLFENGGVGAVQEIDLAVGGSREKPQEEIQDTPALDGNAVPLNLWEPVTTPHWWRNESSGGDPYRQLKDNIETLKEQLRQLLENRWTSSGNTYGSRYRAKTPERASFLMPNGSSFSRRTSIISSSPVTSKI